MLATVMHHLKVGAQKKMVKGPAGWSRSERIPEGHGKAITALCITGTIPRAILS